MSFRQYLGTGLIFLAGGITGLALVGPLKKDISEYFDRKSKQRELEERIEIGHSREFNYDLVLIVADTNQDGVTTKEEWMEAYKYMGIHFDELNPKELTEEELKRYLVNRMVQRETIDRVVELHRNKRKEK